MARFFIDRPIFAWVISIFIMGVGILSILTLPVRAAARDHGPEIVSRIFDGYRVDCQKWPV